MNSSIADLALLGQLFEEHRPRLLAMVDRRLDPALKSRVGSDDVLQDAFDVAKAKWPEFLNRQRGRSQTIRSPSTYSWLYRITLDALINAWTQFPATAVSQFFSCEPWHRRKTFSKNRRRSDSF